LSNSTSSLWPKALINSKKFKGYKTRNSTFPTGNDVPGWSATPSKDPAAMMWYSDAFSQKYLREGVKAARSFQDSLTLIYWNMLYWEEMKENCGKYLELLNDFKTVVLDRSHYSKMEEIKIRSEQEIWI